MLEGSSTDEEDEAVLMVFEDTSEEDDDGLAVDNGTGRNDLGGSSLISVQAPTALSVSEGNDEDMHRHALSPQTHRLYTRMSLFSHPGLRTCDDKCALKHHLEGTSYIPESYDLPTESSAFLDSVRQSATESRASGDTMPLWIFKEAQNSRGRGICLIHDFDQAETVAARSVRGVAQRYLEPLLLDQIKWDLRLYVLMTSVSPCTEVCVYKEGFARFCQTQYTCGGGSDLSMHLTNTAVSDKRGTGGEASVITTSSLWEQLEDKGGFDTVQMKEDIDHLLAGVFSIVAPAVAMEQGLKADDISDRQFSLLGVDVMFDANCRPWLLEINYNPDMTCHAELQRPVKTSLIRDTYNLVFSVQGTEGLQPGGVGDVDMLSWDPILRPYGEEPAHCGGFRMLVPAK